ncbi:MAG TPA: hypothetical protein VHS99_00765 [Chloroflexota bacterium]|jgi:hypothetical protein|nr:hypothetical protein [Chloroflexota bacterium]
MVRRMTAQRRDPPAALRLTAELVPATSWYENVRQVLPREAWDRLRRAVYARHRYRCAICGARGRMNCHEVWEYDDERHVQRLAGFTALCDLCHHVKHLGLAQLMAGRGELDYEAVVRHFMRVNRCDRATFEAHRREVFAQWEARSAHQWHVDFSLTPHPGAGPAVGWPGDPVAPAGHAPYPIHPPLPQGRGGEKLVGGGAPDPSEAGEGV